MVRQETSTETPRPAASLVWLAPVVVTAAAAAFAAAVVSGSARTAVIWVDVIAVTAIAVSCAETVRRGRRATLLSARLAEREATLAREQAETTRLVRELLPQVVRRLRQGEEPEDILESLHTSAEHKAVLSSVLDAVAREEDLRESAQRAFVNIARRVQAIVHQQAQQLREMEDRHGKNPEVFGDLLRIDHGTALIGRLADSIAVLGGARPGRQWSRAVPLYSVMRGAMSRIIDYQRVELHSASEVAVVGPAVEPLIHALAELLDNATRYSPPQTKVHITAVEVNSGIAVEVEDGGVSMSEEARLRAERMLRQARQGIDVNDLGETPRLGLAVVGRLAQAYGFTVSLRSSAYGGVRAVLVVPKELITTVASATGLAHGIGAASGPRAGGAALSGQLTGPTTADFITADAGAADVGAAGTGGSPGVDTTDHTTGDELPVVTERTATGLPQRRRRTPVTAAPAAAATQPEAAPAVQPGMWLAAFQNGLAGEATQTNKGSTQP
ncbi:sensor histidine kinase [Streptomyces jumonjinensis]|uniref:histidine kinase n=1 Tax=Streptomyces jumonjinensis TaxID=1945 RepID=A0A646KIJ9_STRJU|nr:ATP-binding protein [Streptomyces jumonjinensis]MQT01891.1 sensor histidine kinase [Streptomyces jumonjinensis]